MVQITFYSVPQLNDRYFDVFDNDKEFWKPNKTPLEAYLSLYEGPIFTLDNYYLTDGGTLNISLDALSGTSNIYHYSYMKMVDVDRPNNVRYCFIDHIELANNLAIVSYSVDTWHTYSGKMKIHNAIFDRALLGITRKKVLPIAYTTNQAFDFSKKTKENFYVVAELSEYRISDDPKEATLKHNFTAILGQEPEHIDAPVSGAKVPVPYYVGGLNTQFTVEEAQDAINELTAYQGVKSKSGKYSDFDQAQTSAGKRYRQLDEVVYHSKHFTDGEAFKPSEIGYEITQLYAVPKSLINVNELFDVDISSKVAFGMSICRAITTGSGGNPTTYTMKDYGFIGINPNNNLISEKMFEIKANPKTVGFGIVSTFIPDSFDGLTHYHSFNVIASDYGFAIGLKLADGSFSDISSQFEIPLPYTTLNGSERQQQAMAKQMAKAQLWTSIVGTAISVGAVGLSGITSRPVLGYERQAELAGDQAKYSYENQYNIAHGIKSFPTRNTAEVLASKNAQAQGIVDYKKMHKATTHGYDFSKLTGLSIPVLGGALAIVGSLQNINSPVPISDSQTMIPIALVNAAYGFGTYNIIPNNNTEMDSAIARLGYGCQIISDDIHKGMQPTDLRRAHYDVIRLADGYVSGPFSQDVARELETILANGFRIHY